MPNEHGCRIRLAAVAGWAVLLVGLAAGGDWPHWRGASRNGHVDEPSGYREGAPWCAAAPLWRTNVGEGGTSPLVVGNRLYVMGWHDGRDQVLCLDTANGRVLWKHTYASPRYGRHAKGDEYYYSGPSSTPEFDLETKRLYTLSVDGELRCLDTRRRGRLVWRRNLYDDYQVPQRKKLTRHGHRDYGYTSAPLVWGDWLIVEVGSPHFGTLIAWDKRTGKELWRSESRDPAGHTGGPVPIEVAGKPALGLMTQKHVLVCSLDPKQPGRTIAAFPWVTDYANSVASPGTDGRDLYVTSNYNINRLVRFAVAEGRLEARWQSPHPSKVCSPLVDDTCVYIAWLDIRCFDRKSGKMKWQADLALGDPGSLIRTRDGYLVAWTGRGRLILFDNGQRSPDAYRERARTRVWFRHDAWPHVVLAHGRFYLKDRMGNLICLPVSGS